MNTIQTHKNHNYGSGPQSSSKCTFWPPVTKGCPCMLYIMLKYSKSPVTEFLFTFIVVCPHSMTVERGVSTYNLLHSKQRQSFSEDTLVDRLLIHWNGLPTAHYDPRTVVQKFSMAKNTEAIFQT